MPATPKRPRKIRRDAKLLNLPERDRKVIAGWLQSDGVASCLQRIASQYQIQCSQTTLYEAIAFWDSQERRDRVRAKALAQIESEAEEKGYSPQQRMAALDRRMAEIFAAEDQHKEYQDARYLIIADESARTKAELSRLKIAQKDKDIALTERRVVILEKKIAEAEKALGDKSLTGAEQAARIREIFKK